MTTNKIIYRADAYHGIGTGDLLSLVYLSKRMERLGVESHFVCLDTSSARLLTAQHAIDKITWLNPEIDVLEEAEILKSIYLAEQARYLVVELTDPVRKQIQLDDSMRILWVHFDDDLPSFADFFLNWSVEALDPVYQSKINGRKGFFGPQFVLLNPTLDGKVWMPNEGQLEILVSLGGADEHNLSSKVTYLVLALGFKVHLILGYGNDSNINYETHKNLRISYGVKDLVPHILSSRAIICTGGLTLSESCAMKVPAHVICSERHQVGRAKFFHQKGACRYYGFRDAGLQRLRDNFSAKNGVDSFSPSVVDFNIGQFVNEFYSEILDQS